MFLSFKTQGKTNAANRSRLSLSALALAGLLNAAPSLAQTYPPIKVYKSPTCDCCDRWIEHLQNAGFKVSPHNVDDLGAARRKLGMPDRHASCHTAKVGAYAVEGHVPAADVKKLLKEKPKAIGLAMPGMPAGSPGMDIPGSPPYSTLLVHTDGSTRVFATHASPKEKK